MFQHGASLVNYNYEKYPLSPLKPKILALIEQYLPNISDTVYSVHQSTDVNPHFIPSRLRMIQNVDLLWRHRYKSRSPAIVTSQWPIVPTWLLWTLQWNRKFTTAQWSTENTSCFNFFSIFFKFCDPPPPPPPPPPCFNTGRR